MRPDGETRAGDITFWGEWEPPSTVVARWPREPDLPTFLHKPFLASMPDQPELQNTDPLVFGPAFRYSNCKQWDEQNGQPSGLQDLEPGSVILFGSKRQGHREFILDTVFVVGSTSRSYAPSHPRALEEDPFVTHTVVAPLRTFGDRSRRWRFTLFTGATPAEPVEGMYSFVPCLPVVEDGPRRFARPRIELPRFINPSSQQSPAGFTAKDRIDLGTAKGVWLAVVDQVTAAGCCLGFDLAEPPLNDARV
jgi:hypothetical protein